MLCTRFGFWQSSTAGQLGACAPTQRRPIADDASSGGEIAHEALELHVALGEPDVARGDVGPLRVRMRLGDAQRLGSELGLGFG